jgi:hypothetical protein
MDVEIAEVAERRGETRRGKKEWNTPSSASKTWPPPPEDWEREEKRETFPQHLPWKGKGVGEEKPTPQPPPSGRGSRRREENTWYRPVAFTGVWTESKE